MAGTGVALATAVLSNQALCQPPKTATPGVAAKQKDEGRQDEGHSVPHAPGRRFLGVGACFKCHNEKASGDFPSDGWIREDEFLVFTDHDKHAQAFAVLLPERASDAKGTTGKDVEPLAVQMARILRVVDKDNNSLIHRDVRCLTCHVGTPLADFKLVAENLVDPDTLVDPKLNRGVSCEACHGASGDGDQRGWNGIHQVPDKAAWRFLSPQVKRERYGYYDVHDSIARTKLCVSCHVGSVALGRVVTHEMYAAGHPPLSGFEVESYLAQMPPHWLELDRKPKNIRDEFLREHPRRPGDANSLLRARNLVVGSLITWAESLRLSADLADGGESFPALPGRFEGPRPERAEDEPAKKTTETSRFVKPPWPEFSQFACYACHHELKSPSWRQQRGFRTIPGRPTFHEWPTAVLQPALAGLGKERELADSVERITKVLNARPFGDADAVIREARHVADWAETTAQALDRGTFTKEMAAQLLNECVRVASATAPDYDAARQIVFACNVIYQDMKRGGLVAYNGKDPGWYRDAASLDPVEKAFARLQGDAQNEPPLDLQLDLREGQRRLVFLPGRDPRKLRPLDDVAIRDVLKRAAGYEPQNLNARFRAIQRLLSGDKSAPKDE
jgi:hypothetical protein